MKAEEKKMQNRIGMMDDVGNGGIDLEAMVKEGLKNMRVPAVFIADYNGDYCFGEIEGKKAEDGTIKIGQDSKVETTFFDMGNEDKLNAYLSEKGLKRDQTLQLKGNDKAVGQCALNVSIARAVFLSDFLQYKGLEGSVERYLVAINYHPFVEKKLSELGINYESVCRDHGNVILNINVKSPEIKKLTIKTKTGRYCGTCDSDVLQKMSSADALFVNSIKDVNFLMYVYGSILNSSSDPGERPHVYISPTSSMINYTDTGMVNLVLKNSEVYSAGKTELETLLDTKIKTYAELKTAMEEVQSRMVTRDDSMARVYVTCDAKGVAVLDENGDLYHQKAIADSDPLDLGIIGCTTSGCGDALGGVVTSLEYLRTHGLIECNTAEILGYGGIAGQINASNPTASGLDMATVGKINERLNNNPDLREIRKYNPDTDKFEKCITLENL